MPKSKQKFQSYECELIYNKLNKMMDKLLETGVDVSYFPPPADEILKQTAIEMDDIYQYN